MTTSYIEINYPNTISSKKVVYLSDQYSMGGVTIGIRSYSEGNINTLSKTLLDPTELEPVSFTMECQIMGPTASGIYGIMRTINAFVRNQNLYQQDNSLYPTRIVLDNKSLQVEDLSIAYEDDFQFKITTVKKATFTIEGVRRTLIYGDPGIGTVPTVITVSSGYTDPPALFDSTIVTYTAPPSLTVIESFNINIGNSMNIIPSGMIFHTGLDTLFARISANELHWRSSTPISSQNNTNAPFYSYNEDAKFAVSSPYDTGLNRKGVFTFIPTDTQVYVTSGFRAFGTTYGASATYMNTRALDLFGTVKTTYSGANYKARWVVKNSVSVYSDYVTIPYTPTPKVMYLGTLIAPYNVVNATLNLELQSTVASGALQIDTLYLLAHGEITSALAIGGGVLEKVKASGLSTITVLSNYYRDNLFYSDYPFVSAQRTGVAGDDLTLQYRGNPIMKTGFSTDKMIQTTVTTQTGLFVTAFPGCTISGRSQDVWRCVGIDGGLAPMGYAFTYPSGVNDVLNAELTG